MAFCSGERRESNFEIFYSNSHFEKIQQNKVHLYLEKGGIIIFFVGAAFLRRVRASSLLAKDRQFLKI